MPIVLLSPAKTLDESPVPSSVRKTDPRMMRETAALVQVARTLTAPKIKSLMSVSDAIAKCVGKRIYNPSPGFVFAVLG